MSQSLTEKLAAAEDEIFQLRRIIRSLRRGSCWCEMGIGNPMVRTHTRPCEEARLATRAQR